MSISIDVLFTCMKIITAPEEYSLQSDEIGCFLAGGITDCPNWQVEVISNFKKYDQKFSNELNGLVLFNPRRENFPISDPNAAQEQIEWEFKWLQRMDLFSMFFTAGRSDQPICMYELGRNICRMMQRFPNDYQNQILISCDPNYRRSQDVKIQVELAFSANENKLAPTLIKKADPLIHMYEIIRQFKIAKGLI